MKMHLYDQVKDLETTISVISNAYFITVIFFFTRVSYAVLWFIIYSNQ